MRFGCDYRVTIFEKKHDIFFAINKKKIINSRNNI